MTLGIFRTRTRPLGYFAPPARAPRFDLGPEYTPQQAESRQTFQRGAAAFLDYAKRPTDPFTFNPNDPALRAYQEAQQDLVARDPMVASELTQTAAQIALMSEGRFQRRNELSRTAAVRSFSGLGYMVVPAIGPGGSFVDAARAGMPVRIWPLHPYSQRAAMLI